MVREAELVVSRVQAAVAGHQFTLPRPFESSPCSHVEHAVGAVTIFGRIAASLLLDVVHILGIKLRSDVAGDIGVGNSNAVDRPGYLVAATNVELVVHDVSPRTKVGDRLQAVGLIGAG